MSFAVLLSVLLSLTVSTIAHPLPSSLNVLSKRGRSTGATVGLAVGVAIAALLALGIVTFLIVHFRRSLHLTALNRERAVLAGEKNPDGTNKAEKFTETKTDNAQNGGLQVPPTALKRNKSVKDRLMGPLYRGSTIELPSRIPGGAGSGVRDSAIVDDGTDGLPLVNKPWAENSPRPSFSSRRATRMMMMM